MNNSAAKPLISRWGRAHAPSSTAVPAQYGRGLEALRKGLD